MLEKVWGECCKTCDREELLIGHELMPRTPSTGFGSVEYETANFRYILKVCCVHKATWHQLSVDKQREVMSALAAVIRKLPTLPENEPK